MSGLVIFVSECFASVLDSAESSAMLIDPNKFAVVIPIVNGFSLLPLRNSHKIDLNLRHSDKHRYALSGLVWRGGVFWRMMNLLICLLPESRPLIMSISVRLDIWQLYELLH